MAKLYVVGIGPGGLNHMTLEARQALESATAVVGYQTYLDFITPLLAGKEVVSSGMMKEVERCEAALRLAAEGKDVALVSSGDAGVYGMAGLVLELVEAAARTDALPLLHREVEVIVVPGVSAVQAAAAVLGAPLMHDFAVISLSDLMTPWEVIRQRLAAAAGADFVTALYNPRSKGRVTQLEEARQILLTARSAATPVGIVRNACRDGEEKVVTNLGQMLEHDIDMFSIVIIGNSTTFVDKAGRMVTPRGYETAGSRHLALGTRQTRVSQSPEPSAQSLGTGGTRAVMIGGTGSDVGKSVIAAGLCRILKNRGLRVAPFKSQNMALNSAVTPAGGEIGRAQAVQAAACRIAPHTDMNPILLKPTTDLGSQVIVQGTVVGNMKVAEYNIYKPHAFAKAEESFARLAAAYDFVVIEGAGSIAEINLKAHDIANLRVARMANCPVILVADIDRGGVFAQIVGTIELLEPDERAMIRGIIINKFRGDASLLSAGISFIEQRCGIPLLGVVPCFSGFRIPEEDSVALERRGTVRTLGSGKINIGVVKLPRISNYTDFDPLEREADVSLSYIDDPDQVPLLDILILPGSKATIADLDFLRGRGFFPALRSFGGSIVGICGGYQMLGRRVTDPDGVEGLPGSEGEGLGLLDVVTLLLPRKETHQAKAELLSAGYQVAPRSARELLGYEIHMGESILGGAVQPFAHIVNRSGEDVEVLDGAVTRDGRVCGTYLHGLFGNDSFRSAFLNRIRRKKGLAEREAAVQDDPYDKLAAHLEQNLDMERLLRICGL